MSARKFCDMWASGISTGEGHPYKQWKSCNVFVDGRTIYSYGSHFPMGYILAPNVVWLNGDRFSNTTSNHQSTLRSSIPANTTVLIVPNSALQSAGIDYKTLEPIDVHSERWEYTLHTSDTAPSGMSTELTETVTVPDYNGGRWPQPGKPYPTITKTVPVSAGYGHHIDQWTGNTDSLDDVVGTIESEHARQLVRRDPATGEYRWHTARHWLGDAVFTGIRDRAFDGTVGHRNYYISSFDRQERRPLYFMSQLPAPASTVDEAIESLSPDSVKTALDMGRNVVRQGDMFAIPMDITTRQLTKLGATFTKRKVTVELNHYARESVAQRDAVQNIRDDMPEYPKRLYLGDFPGDGTLYDQPAFDVWYEQWKTDCDNWTDELVRRYVEKFPNLPEVNRWSWQSALRFTVSVHHKTREVTAEALYGTAHTATEVATLPDGRQYARGTIYHDPAVISQHRDSDHARRKLGKQWHLMARNTVPVTGTGRGRVR